MMASFNPMMFLIAAGEEVGAYRSLEFDFPESTGEWFLYGGALLVAILTSVALYRRDTREFPMIARVWLIGLRLAVFIGIIVIALNPHERTQKTALKPSRVAILVDTSLSMRHAETLKTSASDSEGRSRAVAVQELLEKSTFIQQLKTRHQVSVYTFDKELTGPQQIFSVQKQSTEAIADPDSEDGTSKVDTKVADVDWDEILRPRGLETRLGEVMLELVRQIGGRTLSGIVVLTDGASNAGVEPQTAQEAAVSKKVRLFTVGVGSTESPVNLQLAKLIAPTDVQLGDEFELTALIQAQGLSSQDVTVQLFARKEDSEEKPVEIESREVRLPEEDGLPVEVKFALSPSDEGRVAYSVVVEPTADVIDANEADNKSEHTVTISDRPTKVLLIAGGPMRDYRFVRNLLFRHPSIHVDVWLQTGTAGISQESNDLLFDFPERSELFEYDVVMAFDPDWQRITVEQREMLNEWVANEAGGLILVAGDVYTSELASAADEMKSVQDLYPVALTPILLDFLERDSTQPRQLEWTPAGREAGFLQLTDDPALSSAAWESFTGMYRCYPSHGAKAGATVHAHFPDPHSQTEYGFPILMASQFYGEGRTLYLGSGEIWRLRALDEEYYDRFWVKAVREVGQGRTKRGTKRGTLLLERNQYLLGQTVNVRARLLDPQYKALDQESVTLEVYDPDGKPLVPAKTLLKDKTRPGEFVGSFRAARPGKYKLELPIPDSNQQIQGNVAVLLPKLEDESLSQDVRVLKELVRDTGGQYFALADAEEMIPPLLPDSTEEFLVDERLRTLWDREWVMYLLVGFLAAEWLTRKLMKLA